MYCTCRSTDMLESSTLFLYKIFYIHQQIKAIFGGPNNRTCMLTFVPESFTSAFNFHHSVCMYRLQCTHMYMFKCINVELQYTYMKMYCATPGGQLLQSSMLISLYMYNVQLHVHVQCMYSRFFVLQLRNISNITNGTI